ncbi:MAG: DUF4230 domain-containing protein [Lewinella sp.]|nr:DUF4230 domain-containing protein [Lewinella sp.]
MRKYLFAFLLGIGIFLLGGWLTYRMLNKPAEAQTHTDSTVLLERVREVLQLVTVEGNFTELYHERNIRQVTLYLPIPTNWEFSRRAQLEVKGRVLVGYNMENVTIKVDSTRQLITLSNLPTPSILAVESDIIYRDIEESFFNSFSPEDFTQLNKNAKEVLVKKAYESGLLERARDQGNAMFDAITFMANSVGWEVQYQTATDSLPAPALPN